MIIIKDIIIHTSTEYNSKYKRIVLNNMDLNSNNNVYILTNFITIVMYDSDYPKKYINFQKCNKFAIYDRKGR